MKKMLLLLVSVLLFACSGENEPAAKGTLSVLPTTLAFDTAAGVKLLDLRTDAGQWSLSQTPDTPWCTPQLTSGRTSTSFNVSVTANTGTERHTTLTFSAPGCDPVEVAVTQAGTVQFNGEPVVPEPDAWDGQKRADITYQLLVYSFADGAKGDRIGDLQGITDHLDYLDAMGVSALWLSPIHPASSYHGYDVLDYAAINPEFGTDADLQTLIDQAAARGIKIYLDYVLNHTSAQHPWFLEAKTNEASLYRDYFIFSRDPSADITAGRIDQIAREGAAGYEASQWYSTEANVGMNARLRFELDWSNAAAPKITVTQTDATPDPENTTAGDADRYLYFGEGVNKRFYNRGGGLYDLTLDFDSGWGFLVRTVNGSTWPAGTKYGAPNAQTIIQLGTPFTLVSDTAGSVNVQFAAAEMFHSHFWTASFADLNYGPAATASTSPAFEAVATAADKWIGMGVGGFRLDAVKHIYHAAYTDENPVFLKQFYDRMNTTHQATGGTGDFYMVGEMYDGYERAAPYYAGIPALFEFDFWHRLSWALQNETGCYFAKDLLDMRAAYAQVRPDYIAATKLTNHDENRAASDLGRSSAKMRLAAAVLLTAQGSPYIYHGEELGYWGTKDNGDEYVRTPILWDAARAQFASAKVRFDEQMLTASISVEAQQQDDTSLLNLYRTYARLRNTYPALATGTMTKHPIYNENNTAQQSIAAWYRDGAGQRLLVLHNFGATEQILTLDEDLDKAVGVIGTVERATDGVRNQVLLGAYSSVVFLVN